MGSNPIPGNGVVVLEGQLGSDSNLGKRAGMLVVRLLRDFSGVEGLLLSIRGAMLLFG